MNHQRAKNRADRASRPAKQRDAAQHHSGDGKERVGAAVGRRSLTRNRSRTSERGRPVRPPIPDRKIGAELGRVDRNPRTCRLRSRMSLQRRRPGRSPIGDREPKRTRTTAPSATRLAVGPGAEDAPGQRVRERPVHVAARDRPWQQGDPEERGAAGDGGDDRLQTAVDDDEPVDCAAPRPARRMPTTPSAALAAVPTTIHDARQLVKTNTMPTERSMPAVMTTKVCAIATSASSTPLLAAVCTTLALNPAG